MVFETLLPFSVATKKMLTRVMIALCFFLGMSCTGFGVWLYVGAAQAYGASDLEVVVCDSQEEMIALQSPEESKTIIVAVSGAVVSPGMYEMKLGDRVGDLVSAAGEFTQEVDAAYVQTALNLARELHDGEGVYVPTKVDTELVAACGELSQLLQASRAPTANSTTPTTSATTTQLISVNTATIEELDTLPGIGEKRAEAISDGRPYSSLGELIEKKILTEALFEELENMIQL